MHIYLTSITLGQTSHSRANINQVVGYDNLSAVYLPQQSMLASLSVCLGYLLVWPLVSSKHSITGCQMIYLTFINIEQWSTVVVYCLQHNLQKASVDGKQPVNERTTRPIMVGFTWNMFSFSFSIICTSNPASD